MDEEKPMLAEKNKPKRRPFGLYFIIGLQLIIAISLSLALLGEVNIATYLKVLVQNPIFYTWMGWVLIGFLTLAVIGLLLLKRWGWILTMIMTGIGLSLSIWSYFSGTPRYIPMLIYIVIVFYLNQRDVQSPFLNKPKSVGVR